MHAQIYGKECAHAEAVLYLIIAISISIRALVSKDEINSDFVVKSLDGIGPHLHML